ncbi:zinc-binding dehydrogenase [Agromyces aurantiacus]|uniref:Zinc-binding dehydrogenase n=1 Tax=Agromyces aurantiacus TaxID=165814 RepID=A0ABV9R362_9MICO|nr:zinc-binding dehydrogenase [Agromyces aurantiacus]MBM7503250.1 NADPH2:quinone reductase [Agromyces aurantiacus]
MRAIVIEAHGGPEVLRLRNRPDPVPAPGEVLVRNRAIGVNFVDLQHREGAPYPVGLPLVPGTEAAGEVVAVGAGVDPSLVGGSVVHFGHLAGAYAELTAVPERFVARLPDEMDAATAAAVAMAGTTAHVLTRVAERVGPEHTVLVHAAAGSTGGAIVALAAAAGARVIGVVSSPGRAEAARQVGARDVLVLDESLPERVRALTGGRGADLVYDANGGPTFDASLAAVARGGVLVLYGQSGGPVAPFDPARLSGITGGGVAGSLALHWVAASHYLDTAAERRAAFDAVSADVAAGRLRPRVSHRFALEDAAGAHRVLARREADAKVLLVP